MDVRGGVNGNPTVYRCAHAIEGVVVSNEILEWILVGNDLVLNSHALSQVRNDPADSADDTEDDMNAAFALKDQMDRIVLRLA